MKGPESVLYSNIRKHSRGCFLQRVENSIDLGTPDVYFSCGAYSGWAELKAFSLPKREGTRIIIPFRVGQYAWARRAMRGGVHMLLVCQTDMGCFIFCDDRIRPEYANRADFLADACPVSFSSSGAPEYIRDWLLSPARLRK